MAFPNQAGVLGLQIFLHGVDERRIPAPGVGSGDEHSAFEAHVAPSGLSFATHVSVAASHAPAAQSVEAVTLTIPLDNALCPLMHACTDGIRFNYAGAVPPGDGHVWAGTWGGGVSRWDGKKWSNLTSKDGLAGNIVYAIARDAKGVFWFGTDKGVSRYDGKSWRSFGRKEGLLYDNVYALAAAPNGDVWAATKRGVVRIGIDQTAR